MNVRELIQDLLEWEMDNKVYILDKNGGETKDIKVIMSDNGILITTK